MKKLILIAALATTAGAAADPVSAAPTTRPATAAASAPVAIDPSDVDYKAAARAEGMVEPTSKYKISARYNQRGAMWSSGRHTGLDFAAPEGTPVVAGASGKVVSAGSGGAYGNLVEIAHGDGVRTLYAHLSKVSVKKGQKVERGQRVGDLHFEVLVDGKNVDPERFINF
jgi:murein DD-endopeptidase MepM/ murein hydrolase activator NlpD